MLKVRNYLLVRLGWDIALVIFNVLMMALRNMQLQSFLTKLVVLILVDGYLNLIIYSYLTQSPFYETDNQSSQGDEEDEEVAPQNNNIFDQ
jgi:hypothetical protein